MGASTMTREMVMAHPETICPYTQALSELLYMDQRGSACVEFTEGRRVRLSIATCTGLGVAGIRTD